MPDDKHKAWQDRKLVAATQPYEVAYFARKWGLKLDQAREIIRKHGPSRKRCNAMAAALLAGFDGSHAR